MSHKRKILMAMAFLIIIKGIFKYHFKPIGQEGLPVRLIKEPYYCLFFLTGKC